MTNRDLAKMIHRCNRCGFCQQVCPTYQATRREGDVARGRVKLAKLVSEGKYNPVDDQNLMAYINNCTLCKACAKNCPGGVETDRIVLQLRAALAGQAGIPPVLRLIYGKLLVNRGCLKGMAKLVRYYETSGVRRFVRKSGVLNVIPGLKNLESLLPPIRNSKTIKDAIRPAADPRFKVAYFLGCGTEAFFTEVALDTIRCLQALGCEVTVPETTCCGAPHLGVGDLKRYRALAEQNIRVLTEGDYDYVITDCATCGAALKEYRETVGTGEGLTGSAAKLAAKVRDLNEFVWKNFHLLKDQLNPVSETVTYHDPCHLVRGQGIGREPREILRAIPGITYVEMPKADWCCGGAGTYCFTHSRISHAILQDKLDNFKLTRASTLATSCPGCMLQLGSGLRGLQDRPGEKPAVKHVIQLLARSLV